MLALEADRAREFYASGDALIPYISEDSQPALWVLVTIYRRLLEKIAEKQYDVFTAKSHPKHLGKVAHPRERFPEAPNLTWVHPSCSRRLREGGDFTWTIPI